MLPLLLTLLVGCLGDDSYIVEGVVLEVRPDTLLVDHEAVPGLMGPMIMPFGLSDPKLAQGVTAGDEIVGRLVIEGGKAKLTQVRITGHPGLPETANAAGPSPVKPTEALPALEVPVTGGETWKIGEGQGKPTVVTFLYTSCPVPEFCPLLVSRLQALQAAVGQDARIVAVTIDPEHDTLPVLQAYAERAGADPAVWRFGRLDKAELDPLAMRAALAVVPDGGKIDHTLRLLVLDADGKLIERYDDNAWPLERVVQQLKTGGPPAPPGTSGTLSASPKPAEAAPTTP